MSNVFIKASWSLQHRGVGGTVRAATNWLRRKITPQPPAAPHPFDLEHGTDTGGLIPGGALASGQRNDRHIAGYAAVPPSRFRGMIARWEASNMPHQLTEYCFVDLGCGKGRALLLASEREFREVVGVELNPALAATAQANAEVWQAAGRARAAIRVEQEDAMEIEWPAGPCLVFLFNPFDGELMRKVMVRIAEVFRDRPSELEILYYKPEQADALAEEFAMVWRETIEIDAQELAIDPVADFKDETRAYRLISRRK